MVSNVRLNEFDFEPKKIYPSSKHLTSQPVSETSTVVDRRNGSFLDRSYHSEAPSECVSEHNKSGLYQLNETTFDQDKQGLQLNEDDLQPELGKHNLMEEADRSFVKPSRVVK